MLSYIYRLAKEYQELHGYTPNLIYLNRTHLNMLRLQLGNPANMDEIMSRLGFAIALSPSATHPSVASTKYSVSYDAV